MQGLDNKQAISSIAQSLDNGFVQTPYMASLEQLSRAIAGNNCQPHLQALIEQLAALDNKEAVNALTAAVTSNNNQVRHLLQLVNAINQQTQGINSNNVQAQFEKLIAAWGAK